MISTDVIILKTTPLFASGNRGRFNISTISTNPDALMPFDIQLFDNSDKHHPISGTGPLPKWGDLFKFENNHWSQQVEYANHNYEIATVLGVKDFEEKLLVYGNKIGKKTISNYKSANKKRESAIFDIKRDDRLLLREEESDRFIILHNITQAEQMYFHNITQVEQMCFFAQEFLNQTKSK